MRSAIRIHRFGVPPVLDSIEDPAAREGEACLPMVRTSLSHIDLEIASGEFGLKPELPYIGGTEGVGVFEGKKYLIRGRGVGLHRDGCWTTLAAVPTDALIRLPTDLDDDTAAAFFGPASTAARAVELGGVTDRDHVLVTGASGAVGSLAAQLCQSVGALVTGVVSQSSKVSHAYGSEVIVGPEAAAAAAQEATVLIDTVGGDTAGRLITGLRRGGRAVMVGYTAGTELELHLPTWLFSDVRLIPVNMVGAERWARERFDEICQMFIRGDLMLRTEIIRLNEIPTGLQMLASGDVTGRIVVRI